MSVQKISGAISITAVENPASNAKNSDEAPLELSLKSMNCIFQSPPGIKAHGYASSETLGSRMNCTRLKLGGPACTRAARLPK
jgi:hypothetical protein